MAGAAGSANNRLFRVLVNSESQLKDAVERYCDYLSDYERVAVIVGSPVSDKVYWSAYFQVEESNMRHGRRDLILPVRSYGLPDGFQVPTVTIISVEELDEEVVLRESLFFRAQIGSGLPEDVVNGIMARADRLGIPHVGP